MRESMGSTKPKGGMKVKAIPRGGLRWDPSLRAGAHHRPVWYACLPSRGVPGQAEQERTRWDPKDGELCLSRLKPGETLVEDRSDSDVQIDRPTWV